MYDVIIIGMGIAGITSAIYAKNSGLKVLILEKESPGGLLNKITTVNNYPGFPKITGPDLALEIFKSVKALEIPYKIADVTNILDGEEKTVETTDGTFKTRFLVLATGRLPKLLGLKDELTLLGKGISTCALCDGNLYKGKDIAVVGAGDSAFEEALYLADLVNKIYLICRSDAFRAQEHLVKKLKEKKNVEFLYNSQVTELLQSNGVLSGVMINKEKKLDIAGLFIYVGYVPNAKILENMKLNIENSYIIVDNHYETNVTGVYAVGDCIKKDVYQLVTAASDGAIAAINIVKNSK